MLGLDRPFAKSGDHDVIALQQIILDDVKEAFNNTEAIFFGDVEVCVHCFDDVSFRQAHGGSPYIMVPNALYASKLFMSSC
jgi:hypothetical protein